MYGAHKETNQLARCNCTEFFKLIMCTGWLPNIIGFKMIFLLIQYYKIFEVFILDENAQFICNFIDMILKYYFVFVYVCVFVFVFSLVL